MIAYSRDAQAGPLRELESLLTEVRCGRFRPDETRSGTFVQDAVSSSSSSACRSASSPEARSPEPQDIPDSDEDLPDPDRAAIQASLRQDAYLRNDRTKRVHVVSPDLVLRCSIAAPTKYTIFQDLPPDSVLCTGCF